MQFADVPEYLKVTQTELAKSLGKTKENLHQYISGRRGKKGEVITTLCEKTGLMSEEVIFPDVTGHPHGKQEITPAYWLNLAHEAVEQAKRRGLNDFAADELKRQILEASISYSEAYREAERQLRGL